MKNYFFIFMFLCISLIWSCKPDPTPTPALPNEEITTVVLKLTRLGDSTDTPTATWEKLDPQSTTPPDTSRAFLNLQKGKVYTGEISFFDKTKTPVVNVTEEIKELANEHLLCYNFAQPQPAAVTLDVSRTDFDTRTPSLPLGLTTKITVGSTLGTGRLTATLRHQPNAKNGDCAPGSTDAEVTFRVTVQ